MACQFPDYPILSYTILGSRRIRENQGLIRISRGSLRFHHKGTDRLQLLLFFCDSAVLFRDMQDMHSRNRWIFSLQFERMKLEILEICHEISQTSKPIYKIYKEFSKTILIYLNGWKLFFVVVLQLVTGRASHWNGLRQRTGKLEPVKASHTLNHRKTVQTTMPRDTEVRRS